MKSITRFFIFFKIFLVISIFSFSYGVKESSTERFKIENFKEEIRKIDFKFDKFGEVKQYGVLGFYNFIPLEVKDKIIAYACLTHLKVYDRHEPFIAIISLDGKILDYSIPEARKKHLILNSKEIKQQVIGEDKSNVEMDMVAGSTFHVPSINAELKNMLNMFEYKKNIIRRDEKGEQ
ncbi:MAG: hypothetical protein RR191_05845 [Cetobacterium sp.]|uniref:hypothetical protein n=1 Tax=Cetobacterium sp. TaxID=2071632 RepID=UPI002FCBF8E0